MDFSANEHDWEFGKMWMDLTEKLVREGKLVPHPKKVWEGGLDKVLEGCEDLKSGRISGKQLVYRI